MYEQVLAHYGRTFDTNKNVDYGAQLKKVLEFITDLTQIVNDIEKDQRRIKLLRII